MSDSGRSSVDIVKPQEVEYEQSLKRAVRSGLKGNEDVTINSARACAERELGLEAGFFKSDPQWKGKSKAIIQAAVDDAQSSPEKPQSKSKPEAIVPRAKAGTKRKSDDSMPASNKRSKKVAKSLSDSEAKDGKMQTTAENEEEEEQEGASEIGDSEDDGKPKTTAKKSRGKSISKSQTKSAKKIKDESDSELDAEGASKPARRKPTTKKDSPTEASGVTTPEDDDSDMSVLIDDPPPRKKRASNGTKSTAKAAKPSKPAASKKKGPDLSPNEQEIKRLQGWIVKCGVRKVWGVYLKEYETDRAKIQHLKKMLDDLGMSGRYSNEKAKGIREARELAAELEDTRNFAANYGTDGKIRGGTGSDDEETSEGDEAEEEETKAAAVPRRPKGFVDFGDSGDEVD